MNLVKKIIAFSLANLIVINSLLSVFIFIYLQESIKSDVRRIKPEKSNMTILKFSTNELSVNSKKIIFKNKSEFFYEGNLYDIIKKSVDKDSVTFVCHLDKKEKELINNYNKSQNNNDCLHKLLQVRHQLISTLFFEVNDINTTQFSRKIYFKNFFKSEINSQYPEVQTPPPRLS